jgi:hypothetical protein
MLPGRLTSSAIAAVSICSFISPAPLFAQTEQQTTMSGHCQYSDEVARYHHETTLILCDTASINRAGGSVTLDFSQRSWGSMAQFTGDMAGDEMAVSRMILRDGKSVPAKGTCKIFYIDGKISVISCLAKAGSRSVTANFVPSRL